MVATVVNITSASSGDRYYLVDGFGSGPGAPDGDGPHDSRPDSGGGDYYARTGDEHRKASHWRGAGAAALKLRGHIGPEAFRQVLEGCVPGTDIRLGRVRDGAHEHRPGVDITLSAPKSVSLEALLPGRGNARAMRAHNAAVRATLDFIETRLLKTRRWDRIRGRSGQVNAPYLVAATFRHVTSRNNDPQLHTHCVIANMTRSGGRWRSVEIGLLRRSERLIGAYYRNELAHRLRKAGFALRPSMIGPIPGFEIAGWADRGAGGVLEPPARHPRLHPRAGLALRCAHRAGCDPCDAQTQAGAAPRGAPGAVEQVRGRTGNRQGEAPHGRGAQS